MRVKITERGWAGHYICADRCRFRRNTLVEYGEKKWVVSTVGNLIIDGKLEQVGLDRYYETMAFEAEINGEYIDADVEKQIFFENDWGLWADTEKEFCQKYPFADNDANDMHEKIVDELKAKIVGDTECNT